MLAGLPERGGSVAALVLHDLVNRPGPRKRRAIEAYAKPVDDGQAVPLTCCGPALITAGTELGGTAAARPKIPGRSPAACGARRRLCGRRWRLCVSTVSDRSASKSPLSVRATPAAGSSKSMRAQDIPSAPSASETGLRHNFFASHHCVGRYIRSLTVLTQSHQRPPTYRQRRKR